MSVFIGYPSFMAYQMMKGKKDNNDGFPSIPGMIARYSALGLTNEQMAANPVWVDKTGNGHDLQMKNFLWGGMSGVGGVSTYYDKYEFTPDKYYMVAVSSGTQHAQFTFKVTGLVDGNILSLADTSSPSNVYGKWTQDGIYTVDIDVINTDRSLYFYNGVSATRGEFTIEILPLYPGALVFDGVDDYGTCNNFPILTKEKGYTVVALRQWIEEKNSITALVSNSKNWNRDGAFVFEYNNLENNFPNLEISFGSNTNLGRGKSSFTYQTSKLYNGKEIKFGEFLGSDKLIVAKANENLSPCSNVAIWELVFLDHDATEEELTKIKDYFVKTYPWLFPDQGWTVTGKTNEDEDRATIANITGNGNDLVLSNFGFAEGSGYNEEGEYAGYLVTDGVDDIASSNTIIYEADFTFIGEWKFIQKADAVAGISSIRHLYIQNRYNRGATIMINSTFENKKNITDYMTFKAITSKGKAYDENWNEVDLLYGDGYKGPSGVSIGGQVCHMIFKNMALYMNKVFSKDDCIKAYNYLQTLKAK